MNGDDAAAVTTVKSMKLVLVMIVLVHVVQICSHKNGTWH